MADWQLLLVHSLAVFAIGLFTAGFLALDGAEWTKTQKEHNFHIPHAEILENELKNSSQGQRLVLMMIDALRDDFLDRSEDLPFITQKFSKGQVCSFDVQVDTPTVTMPRIKSLITGRPSKFIDVILNLGSAELLAPNLIKNVGPSKAVFYGDDTWLKLLPDAFLRAEGTHSFFVNDFYEVDKNVSRHVAGEMKKSDWNLLILHYLGLDHIGHVEGPRSKLVGPKLREMDGIAKLILQGFSSGQEPLLLITGDHGMHDGGGHGGSTAAERTVGLALLGAICVQGRPSKWLQVDIAPTMAVLLGVEVPEGSVGAIIPELLHSLGRRRSLAALYSNTRRLLESAPGHTQENLFLEAVILHERWLKVEGLPENSEWAVEASDLYTKAAITMRNILVTDQASFDLYAMFVGATIVFLCALWVMASLCCENKVVVPVIRICGCAAALIGLHSISCGFADGRSLVCLLAPFGMGLQLVISLSAAFTITSLLANLNRCKLKMPKDWPLIILATFHTFSLGSSFCVEEEHLVWYVIWPLVLLVATARWPRRWPLLAVAALGHLVLSQFNSTGDKWASAPDIEDWLVPRPEIRSGLLACGLLSLLPLLGGGRMLSSALLCLIYLHKTATKSVILPIIGEHLSQNGLVEAWCFYALLCLYLMTRLSKTRRGQRMVAWRDTWLLLAALLRRPHDVLALAYVAFSSRLAAACLPGPAAAVGVTAVGWAGFFYQGNSNGLASLDVAAGYVGLQSYRPLVVSFQMLTHTYAAPVLAFLELATARGDGKWLRAWSCQRLVAAAFYLIVAAWLREHLFVWSVFAPKLLFEGVHSLVFLIVLILFNCGV